MKIDTTQWQWFRFDVLFDIVKGKRLTTANMVMGEIPFIGSTAFRNGVTAFVDINEHIHPGNTITVSYNGSVGQAFYQPEPFYACDDVNVFYPKFRLNRSIAFFVITMIKQERYRFDYGRKWNLERMLESQIKLPADKNQNPDWKYMENYMRSLEEKIQFRQIKTNNSVTRKPIDTSRWKEFTLYGKNGLFIYQHGTRLTVPARIPGDIPMITAGKHNQGYAQSIANYEECECFAPGITVDMFSNTFYQNFSFVADDNIYVFNKPQKLNKYMCLFLATVINQQQYKYGYGRQFRKEDAEKNVVKLPVTPSGEPDWEFMEQYIKSLPYADLI